MEVQGRTVPGAERLRISTAARALLSTRAQTLVALAAVVGAAAWIAFSQPYRSPWWIYADADATYVGSSLAVVRGGHTRYLDHPGLPVQEALAATFGGEAVYDRLVDGTPRTRYVDARLRDLDSTRPIFRGWAIAFFLGGAALTFLVTLFLFGHWSWATAGGLMWLGAPELSIDSIQIRPDSLLAALCLLSLFLAVRAYERREAGRFLVAAFVLGLTLTVKVQAIGLLLPLALAALLAHPRRGWPEELRASLVAFLRRRRYVVAAAGAAWLALAAAFNASRVSFSPSGRQAVAAGAAAAVVVAYCLLSVLVHRRTGSVWARRLFDPFCGLLVLLLGAGVALPITFLVDDGLRMLASMSQSLRGNNVNGGIDPFGINWDQFTSFPLRQAAAVFIVAGVAAAVGLLRGDLRPGLWFAGAVPLAVLAAARLSVTRYYAPAFVVSIPAAIWLFHRTRSRLAPLLLAVFVAYVVVPQFQHRHDAAHQAAVDEQLGAQYERVGAALLAPGQVLLTPDYAPVPDVRLYGVVGKYPNYVTGFPYRYVPDGALEDAVSHGLVARYYVGPAAVGLSKPGTMTIGGRPMRVRPLPRLETPDIGALELAPASAASAARTRLVPGRSRRG